MGAFENHHGPVYGLEIYQDRLYTCSGDNMARAFSLSVSQSQAQSSWLLPLLLQRV